MYDEVKEKMSHETSTNEKLRKQVDSLALQLDANEQHNRNECLLLHGVAESDKEAPSQSKALFGKLIFEHLGISMNEYDIKRAHRLGQRKQNGKPRPIIVRLRDPELRNKIYFNKKSLKGKPVSITENLTKRRMQEKIAAEKLYGEKSVWTKEGRIYAKDSSGQVKTIVS